MELIIINKPAAQTRKVRDQGRTVDSTAIFRGLLARAKAYHTISPNTRLAARMMNLPSHMVQLLVNSIYILHNGKAANLQSSVTRARDACFATKRTHWVRAPHR